ncbi:lysine--tRNA ligase [Candidatus Azambacteria bacterium]|nr:lysine--tRNA ligase [Candidatus Azambacteria bacterium]
MATNLSKIKKVKAEKVAALRAAGVEPYPETKETITPIAVILKQFDEFAVSQKKGRIAGRVIAKREHGGATFVDIFDGTAKMQAHYKQDLLGPDTYRFLIDYIDIGDFVESSGPFFITRRGEQTQEVVSFSVIAKALMPLPEKWHGLADVDERFRKRYLDILMNEDARKIFVKRAVIMKALRDFLDEEGYMEVETPVLQTVAGGAIALPFKTRLNALKMDLFLRVAPELYLKRLLVGGYPKVYEIGRCFRNEGMDATHNPDFTMMECYAAYQNYKDGMAFTERMIRAIFAAALPESHLQLERDGKMIDLQSPFAVVKFNDLLKKYAGIDYDTTSAVEMAKKAKQLGVAFPKGAGKGKIADELYKELARPHLVHPTFMTHHPLELSPLAKRAADDQEKAARFQLVVAGIEMVNGYSELNDPAEQLARFKAQDKLRKKGDAEAQPMDHDFIDALEYGMPPAVGVGVGIERLVALVTGVHSVREVMLFPTMRPKKGRK